MWWVLSFQLKIWPYIFYMRRCRDFIFTNMIGWMLIACDSLIWAMRLSFCSTFKISLICRLLNCGIQILLPVNLKAGASCQVDKTKRCFPEDAKIFCLLGYMLGDENVCSLKSLCDLNSSDISCKYPEANLALIVNLPWVIQ